MQYPSGFIYMFPIDAITTYYDFTTSGTKILVGNNDPKTILSFSVHNTDRNVTMSCGPDSFNLSKGETIPQELVNFYCPSNISITSNGEGPVGFMTYVPRDIRIVQAGASTISGTIELGPETSEAMYGSMLVVYAGILAIVMYIGIKLGLYIIKK